MRTKANYYYFGAVSTTALALMVALSFGLLIEAWS